MGNFVLAVVVVVQRGASVLAMRRATQKDAGAGAWETIAGRVEVDEDPLAAAAREVREESGLEVRLDPRPVDAYTARRAGRPMGVVVYRADWIAGEVRLSDEHDAHRWCSVDELAELTPFGRLAEAVRRAVAGARA